MLETSCKVGLQPEGAHYHLETVIINMPAVFSQRLKVAVALS